MNRLAFVFLLALMPLISNAQNIGEGGDTIHLTHPIDPVIDPDLDNPRMPIPTVILNNHTLYIYAEAEKQVSIYPVDYDDHTTPLFTTYVPENTYSCVLPSWLVGVYAIEIEINGIIFVGEIEL